MNEMVIIIRPSFKKICGPDACRAAVFNHILYRLARKAKDEPEDKVKKGEVFWFASAEDICKDMDNAWCVNKIRKEIKVLFESGLLGQRHNPLKKWDRKFQYFISDEQGAKLLEKCKEAGVCLMHIGLNSEVLHLLFMVNAFDKYGGCICQEKEMDTPNMVDANTKYGRAIPKGSTKGSSEESNQEESTDASAIASATHTPFASQQQQAEPIRIATSEQGEREKAERDVTESENYSQDVAQANVVGEALSGRAVVPPTEKTKKGGKAKAVIVELVPTAEEQAILDMWQSIFKRRIPINEALIKAAARLVPCEPTLQDLKDCRGFCYTSNGEWYKKKGVQLSDIVGNWAKWQTTLELPPMEEAPLPDTRDVRHYASKTSSNRVVSSFSDPNFTVESEMYPSEAERRAEYAAAE